LQEFRYGHGQAFDTLAEAQYPDPTDKKHASVFADNGEPTRAAF
jgi:hypothetical protein